MTTTIVSVLVGLLVGLGVGVSIANMWKGRSQEGETRAENNRPRAGLTLFVGGLLVTLFAVILAAGILIYWLNAQSQQTLIPPNPEIVMGILVVGAIAALMTVLFVMAVGFSSIDLTDSKQALGLPEGSIRAMIALVLIMVFIIFGIHLFRRVSEGDTTYLGKMKAVPAAKELGVRNVLSQKNTDTTYEVWTVTEMNDEGKRLAQQLITLVGTLVVSVSSFYFGSSTATSAAKKEREAIEAALAKKSASNSSITTVTSSVSEPDKPTT